MFAVCVTRDPDSGLNSGKAKPLYDLLVSFADVSSRDTEKGYPYREALATCLDCSKQTVDRAADYLAKELGLVTVHRRKVEGKPDENDANLYEIHDAWLIHGVTPPSGTPPQLVARYGHTIPGLDVEAWISEHAPAFDLHAWQSGYDEKMRAQAAKREEQRGKERARRQKAKKRGGVMDDATPAGAGREGGDVMGDARGGVMDDVTGGVMGDALSKAGSPEPSSRDDAPSARSAADGRRPSTGSRGSRAGGFAASGKTKPPSLNREQRQQASAFFKALPQELAALVPDRVPANLATAVLEALAVGQPQERTPQQLIEYRLLPKWHKHYASRDTAGPIEKPVGVLIAMLRWDAECRDDRCDERTNVDNGQACVSCQMRGVDRRADREREPSEAVPQDAAQGVPAPRTAPSDGIQRSNCKGDLCGGVLIKLVGPAVQDGLCSECRTQHTPTRVVLPAVGGGATPTDQYRAARAMTGGRRIR